MNANQQKSKQDRYKASIEALQNLITHDNEIEPVKAMLNYLQEQERKLTTQPNNQPSTI